MYNNRINNTFCALGHCGVKIHSEITEEAKSLRNLIFDFYHVSVVDINDGIFNTNTFNQITPKQRILAALEKIKESEQKKEIQEKIVYKTVLIDVNVKQLIKELQEN